MLPGDNRTEDKRDNRIETEKPTDSKDTDKVQKAYDDVRDMMSKLEMLKAQAQSLSETDRAENSDADALSADSADEKKEGLSEIQEKLSNEEIERAERAVIEHARREVEEHAAAMAMKKQKREDRVAAARRQDQEAKERFEQRKREAEEKQRKLEEAEKNMLEKRKARQQVEYETVENQHKRAKEAEAAAKKREEDEQRLRELEEKLEQERAANAEKAQRLILREKEKAEKEIRRRREEQNRRERKLLEEQARRERKQAEELARRERKQAEIKAKQEKKQTEIKARQEKELAREAERKKKQDRENLIAEQRALQKKKREQERLEKTERRRKIREEKIKQRQREKERDSEERAERKRAVKEKKEIQRKKKIAAKSAEKGGGIVAIHGTTVQTEIQPVAAFSWKEFFGFAKRKEIKATTSEEEREALREENEKIKQEARATAAQLAEWKAIKRNSAFVENTKAVLKFCDDRKKSLLIAFSIILALAVGTAAAFNFCTVYEYSYNGKTLGYVKNKDDVLQITELVQTALTEEKNVNVVIDARDDIDFKRVNTIGEEIAIDSKDDVLRRLTYMGDLNVKAYGIYVDGKKIGAVQDKETAAKVFEKIKNKYATNLEGSEIKEAIIVEKVDVHKSNTPLKEVKSKDEMVEALCTPEMRTAAHIVERGDSLDSIAKLYNVKKKNILADNEIADPEKLEVGSTIIINETAPIITVRITEVRDHIEKTSFEVIKKKDKDMYEGYCEVDQKGQKGISQIKDKTVTVNGDVVSLKVLDEKVEKEPVAKIVRVGTKERPPTVGSGVYIWPANDGTYVVTSEFKWRWGRQHQGIDMGCSTGNDVLAADGGTVTFAGWMGGYGNLVIIDHQNGVETYYGHNSSLCVKTGDKVFRGQHIAEAGNTGNSFGSHIHFGVKDHGEFKNPRNYLP